MLPKHATLNPSTCPQQPSPEPCRLNRVVSLVGTTLRDLRLAIAGTIALSDELAEALDALFNARVPKRWAKIRCEGSLSRGSPCFELGVGSIAALLVQSHGAA